MATRLYYERVDGSLIQPAITPAYDAEWESTGSAARRALLLGKNSDSFLSSSIAETAATAPYDVLFRQFISPSLKAQTISGTIKGQIKASEANADADYNIAIVVKVISIDGGTVRGTLLSYFPGFLTSEFSSATLTNKNAPPSQAINSVDCLAGDRIVVELGYRSFNTHTTSRLGYFRFGNNSATDLPENETETADYCPWLEFSQDLVFFDATVVDGFVEYLYEGGVEKVSVCDGLVEYLYIEGTPEPTTHRQFPVPPVNRRLQSQEDKRQFPIVQ